MNEEVKNTEEVVEEITETEEIMDLGVEMPDEEIEETIKEGE